MPRIFDPERSDPTVKLISSVRAWFEEKKYRLSDEEISVFIGQMLRGKKYAGMVDEYLKKGQEFPDIVVKNSCSNGHFFFDTYAQGNAIFPSRFKQKTNEIMVCADKVKNLMELQENLDRELVLAYDHHFPRQPMRKGQEEQGDAKFACSQIRACRVQMDNYTNIDDSTKKNLASTCARFLLRHRGPNEEKLPYDMWLRYSEKLLEKFDYCYNDTYPFAQSIVESGKGK